MTELLDLAALVVLGLLLAAFAVLLFVAILFNARAGERYRKRLAQRLDGLRLGRMLSLLGIDSNDPDPDDPRLERAIRLVEESPPDKPFLRRAPGQREAVARGARFLRQRGRAQGAGGGTGQGRGAGAGRPLSAQASHSMR